MTITPTDTNHTGCDMTGPTLTRRSGTKEPVHTYPSDYPPGKHWAITQAWEVLDILDPGVLSDEARALLVGVIAGKLMKERRRAACIAERGRNKQIAEEIRHGP